MNTQLPLYFRHWGKADPNYLGDPEWYPLVAHSPHVASVGSQPSIIVLYGGVLTVTEPDKFADAPKSGIGHGKGKGMGIGLLSIAPNA